MSWEQGRSARSQSLPPDWSKIRARVLKRDGYQCVAVHQGVRCVEPATDADHIQRGTDHSLANLQALCSWHHARKTAAEAAAARRARPSPSRRRPPDAHPGAL